MNTYRYFQARPIGENVGNFALSYQDAKELLIDCVYTDYNGQPCDDFEILETSTFGNGVLVKARLKKWVVEVLRDRPEVNGDIEEL